MKKLAAGAWRPYSWLIRAWAGKERDHPDAFNPYYDPPAPVERRGIECTVAECAGIFEQLGMKQEPPRHEDTKKTDFVA